jgi:hypothetical protein
MADTLRRAAGAAPADGLTRPSLDRPALARWLRAGVAGALVFALLYALLEARIADALPGYPAVFLVTLVMLVVPGLVACEALFAGPERDLIERLVIAFAIGVAIAAPAGLLALLLRVSLDDFVHWHLAIATLSSATAGYFARPRRGPSWTRSLFRGWNAPALLLLLLAVVAAAGILTSPRWAGDRPARNFDDWRYMTYVNSYMQEDRLDPLHPVGVGEAPYPRMAVNVWVVIQAAVARSAGVSAESVVLDDMTPLLAVFALAATYCLAKGLFRKRSIALLAVLVQLGIALTDLSRDEGLGLGLLLRTAEDKFVATYVLFPLSLLFAAKFVSRPRLDSLLTFVLIGLAMFIVHPQPLLFLGISLFSFAVLRGVMVRSWRPLSWMALLAIPLGVFTFGEYLSWQLFNTSWPIFFKTTLTWRETFKIVHLPGGLIMGNYHLLLHPLMLGALALAPLIWLRARKAAPHQLLAAATLGWLPFFFVPPLTTVAAKLASTELTARLPQTAPIAIVWAYALYVALHWTRSRWPARLNAGGGLARLVAPTMLAALVLAGGLLIQELYYPLDRGGDFTWSSPHTIVPRTGRSIFLGGKDRLLSRQWRVKPEDREVFAYLNEHAETGSTVLMPEEMSLYMPGVLWKVKPAFSQGILGQWQRPTAQGLYADELQGLALTRALNDGGIDYVVVKEVSNAGREMSTLPSAQFVVGIGPYQLFQVGPRGP